MYTILDGKIYLIESKNLVECVIEKGKFKKTTNKITRPSSLERISTFDEIRRNFISEFNKVEDEEEPIIEEKPKKATKKEEIEEE